MTPKPSGDACSGTFAAVAAAVALQGGPPEEVDSPAQLAESSGLMAVYFQPGWPRYSIGSRTP